MAARPPAQPQPEPQPVSLFRLPHFELDYTGCFPDRVKVKKTIKFWPLEATGALVWEDRSLCFSHRFTVKDQFLKGKFRFDSGRHEIQYRCDRDMAWQAKNIACALICAVMLMCQLRMNESRAVVPARLIFQEAVPPAHPGRRPVHAGGRRQLGHAPTAAEAAAAHRPGDSQADGARSHAAADVHRSAPQVLPRQFPADAAPRAGGVFCTDANCLCLRGLILVLCMS